MKSPLAWLSRAPLWVAPLFALLALLAGPAHARAQDAASPDGSICPWGRMCHGPVPFAPAALVGAAAPSDEATPAPQGDFTRAAFASFRDDNYEIYVARGDGTQAVNITNNVAWDLYPQLSPDGAQVVFASDRDHPTTSPTQARIYNLYISNADGTGLRRLTTGGYTQARPVWSPDGSHILFAQVRSNNSDIYAIQSDGTQLKRLTTSSAPDFDPIYAPDGSTIYWVRQVSSSSARLMHANADGTGAAEFSPPLNYLQRPVISPTGLLMAHEVDSNADGWLDVVLIPLDDLPYHILSVVYGEPLADRAVAGWSPALALNSPNGELAVRERSLFISTWLYLPNHDDPTQYDLVGVRTDGYKGWADARPMHSSLFDFDLHAVSLDRQPPVATVSAPPLLRMGTEGLAYTLADAGGAGVGYLEWLGTQVAAPNEPALVQTVAAGDGPGRRSAEWQAGSPASIKARAWDLAGNVGPWSTPVVSTTYYEGTACTLSDGRAIPTPGAFVTFGAETPFLMQAADAASVTRAWFGIVPTLWQLQGEHPVFGPAPFPSWMPWRVDNQDPTQSLLDHCGAYFHDRTRDAIHNGGFNASPADTGWRMGCGVSAYAAEPPHGALLWLGDSFITGCVLEGKAVQASQAIAATATATMHKPTLSFMYRMTQTPPLPQPGPSVAVWPLKVFVTEAGSSAGASMAAAPALTVTQVFTQGFVPEGPALGWADLSPWAGRAITVTFALSPSEALVGATAQVDEISISPWETPVVQDVALATAAAQAQLPAPEAAATLLISGANFMLTPTVTILANAATTVTLSLSAPPTETLLRAALPQGLAPGRYRVRVTNPGGLYGEMDFSINLAETLFLPITSK